MISDGRVRVRGPRYDKSHSYLHLGVQRIAEILHNCQCQACCVPYMERNEFEYLRALELKNRPITCVHECNVNDVILSAVRLAAAACEFECTGLCVTLSLTL